MILMYLKDALSVVLLIVIIFYGEVLLTLKTLIIPDIHTRYDIAELIIDKVKPDKTVFLGDYLDAYDDSIEIMQQTCNWLHESLKNPDRIHLLGNHDLSYMKPDYRCSGFSEGKLFALNTTKLDLTKLQHFTYVGDWLCTHSGLSYDFYKAYNPMGLNPSYYIHALEREPELRHRLYQCSPSRGGRDAHSGIVWCDYGEFIDIPGTKQIFGHTLGELRETENHICLDTGLHYYAVHQGNNIVTKKTPEKFFSI